MKVDALQHERNRVDTRHNHIKGIIDWGKDNDYPQSVVDIVGGSFTGVACLDIYTKFIFGQGFADTDNYQIIVNEDGETADTLLEKVAHDYAMFGGFAIHVNRNILGQITSMRYVPIENVRLCSEDSREHKGQVALHPDWGKRLDIPFHKHPIEYINQYDSNREVLLERIAEVGGIWNYRGEVYVYSNLDKRYPLPIYDAALTDMSTQEAISNIAYRNSRHGFLPAGCFVEINEYYDDENPEDKAAFDAVTERLKSMQGDKATSSIMHVVAKDKDSVPQLLQMKSENYDKEFSVTREATRQNIGQAFRQPEELRCEKTAQGFSNDAMVQAYKVYNSVTSKERHTLENVFTTLFKNWWQPLEYNFQIKPLSYGSETIISELGDNTKDVIEIIKDNTISIEQRKAILMRVYGLDEDVVNDLLLINNQTK